MTAGRLALSGNRRTRSGTTTSGRSTFDVFGLGLMVLLVAVPGVAALKLACIALAAVMVITRQPMTRLGVGLGFSVAGSLAVAYMVGAVNDVPPEDRLNHLLRVASFYAVFLCAWWTRPAFNTSVKLDRLCIYIAAIMAGVKIGIWLAVVGFGLSLDDAMGAFGFETVTLTIAFNLFRLQFPSDVVCLFLIAVYTGGRSFWRDFLFLVCVAIVVFLSFSRFYFACFVVGLVVRAIWIKRWDTIMTCGALVLVATLGVFGDELVERFVGDGSAISDETRVEQKQALSADIDLHPILGRGIGAAVPNFSRSESLPFSYEVQWYAMVMQFGWLGTTVFLINIFSILLMRVRRARVVFCVMTLTLLWIVAGFTNPLITAIGSAAGLAITGLRARLS